MLLSTGKCSQSWLHTGAIKGARDQVSCSSGWPQTSYVAETSLELPILLPLLSKAWHYRCSLSHLAIRGLGELLKTTDAWLHLHSLCLCFWAQHLWRQYTGLKANVWTVSLWDWPSYLAPGYWSAHPYSDVAHSLPDHYGNRLQERCDGSDLPRRIAGGKIGRGLRSASFAPRRRPRPVFCL